MTCTNPTPMRPIRNVRALAELLEDRERPVRPGMITSAAGGRVRRPLHIDY